MATRRVFSRVQAEPIALTAPVQCLLHPLSIALVLEAHDQVIGVTHQKRRPAQAWPYLRRVPAIHHHVQIDVRQ
jgi:hypothetical protein